MKSASHKEWMGVGDGHKLYILIMIPIATVSYLDSLVGKYLNENVPRGKFRLSPVYSFIGEKFRVVVLSYTLNNTMH